MRNPDFSIYTTDRLFKNWDRRGIKSEKGLSNSLLQWEITQLKEKYSTVKQDCFAIVSGIKAVETYLIGKLVIFQMDHQALQ